MSNNQAVFQGKSVCAEEKNREIDISIALDLATDQDEILPPKTDH